MLEKKEKNTHLKQHFFKKKMNQQPELIISQFDQVGGAKAKRMEKALEKALQWQSNIEDTREKVNNKVYVGPHKWIVCLIGSDSYTV